MKTMMVAALSALILCAGHAQASDADDALRASAAAQQAAHDQAMVPRAGTLHLDHLSPEQAAQRVQVCSASRPKRVAEAQGLAKTWATRVAAVQSRCRYTEKADGAARWDGDRVYAEVQYAAVCRKGPPKGETLESATEVLASVQPDVVSQSLVHGTRWEEGDVLCADLDKAEGLPELAPTMSDLPAVKRLAAVKAKRP